MTSTVAIENIDEMRQLQGIDDIELRESLRGLQVGDVVRLTFTSSAGCSQTAPVRITQIQGSRFRGKTERKALSLLAGKQVVFSLSHVHSVVQKRPKSAVKTEPREIEHEERPLATTSRNTPSCSTRNTQSSCTKSKELMTLEEHSQRIEALSKKIIGYTQFVYQMVDKVGVSSEVKTRSAKAFYEQLVVVERQLGCIYDELQLE